MTFWEGTKVAIDILDIIATAIQKIGGAAAFGYFAGHIYYSRSKKRLK